MKNLKNLDPSKGNLFAYLTSACWTAFIVYLKKHYDTINLKREMLLDAMHEAEERYDIQQSTAMKELIRQLEEWQLT